VTPKGSDLPFGRIEVVVGGKTIVKESGPGREYSRGQDRMSDEDLVKKFRHNAVHLLGERATQQVIEQLMGLESVERISSVMQNLRP
jgi:Lhr-like helicase